jgi:hypothetical protein
MKDWTSSIPTELATHITSMMTILEYLLETMDDLRQDLVMKALHSDISADVLSIFTTICSLKSTLGTNNKLIFPDVWSGICELSATTSTKSLDGLTNTINGIDSNNTILEGHIAIKKTQQNSHLTNLLPVLAQQNTKMKI